MGNSDKLDRAFMLQREYMDMLVEHDKFPEYPVDLETKIGQRFVKECTFNCIAELMEATGLGKPTEVRDSFDR